MCKFSLLSTVLFDDTRRSSMYHMICRCCQSHPAFCKHADPAVDALLPNTMKEREIDKFLSKLKGPEPIQLDLQQCDITLSEVCDNFLEVLEKFLSMEERLGPLARIVKNSLSEDAIVMI